RRYSTWPMNWVWRSRRWPRCWRCAWRWRRCTWGSPRGRSADAITRCRPDMRLLRNAVRPYAWGSRTALAEFTGRPAPTEHPEAELWMGAHPQDPSRVATPDGGEQSLLELIESDPSGQLGPEVARRFSDRLPFLLKV